MIVYITGSAYVYVPSSTDSSATSGEVWPWGLWIDRSVCDDSRAI